MMMMTIKTMKKGMLYVLNVAFYDDYGSCHRVNVPSILHGASSMLITIEVFSKMKTMALMFGSNSARMMVMLIPDSNPYSLR